MRRRFNVRCANPFHSTDYRMMDGLTLAELEQEEKLLRIMYDEVPVNDHVSWLEQHAIGRRGEQSSAEDDAKQSLAEDDAKRQERDSRKMQIIIQAMSRINQAMPQINQATSQQ